MYKIAVMGGADTVLGFKALGLETHPVSGADEARRILRQLTTERRDVAIIYVEETFASALSSEIDKYKSSVKPAIILIPGREGASGHGLTALHDAVKRAIGTDIL
ncbi:MAG: V-type ATP synthase subunit F [Clostridiales bacterium]|nr:V-type ATP synthase subunit F [Clostridiales bacterium]